MRLLEGQCFQTQVYFKSTRLREPEPTLRSQSRSQYGDAALVARMLADELERREDDAVGFRSDSYSEKIEIGTRQPVVDHGAPGSLDPRVVMQRLDPILPRQKTIIVDSGHHMMFSIEYLSVDRPEDLILPLEFYSIGNATGIALGAAVARPDQLTVYAAGDAGLMMFLGELETAARYGLRLLVLVTNDSGIGAELHLLRQWGLPDDVCLTSTPSFESVGEALGADGVTIRDITDLDALRGRVAALSRPLVVDILVFGRCVRRALLPRRRGQYRYISMKLAPVPEERVNRVKDYGLWHTRPCATLTRPVSLGGGEHPHPRCRFDQSIREEDAWWAARRSGDIRRPHRVSGWRSGAQ